MREQELQWIDHDEHTKLITLWLPHFVCRITKPVGINGHQSTVIELYFFLIRVLRSKRIKVSAQSSSDHPPRALPASNSFWQAY